MLLNDCRNRFVEPTTLTNIQLLPLLPKLHLLYLSAVHLNGAGSVTKRIKNNKRSTLKSDALNPFVSDAHFLYTLKTAENRKVFRFFRE